MLSQHLSLKPSTNKVYLLQSTYLLLKGLPAIWPRHYGYWLPVNPGQELRALHENSQKFGILLPLPGVEDRCMFIIPDGFTAYCSVKVPLPPGEEVRGACGYRGSVYFIPLPVDRSPASGKARWESLSAKGVVSKRENGLCRKHIACDVNIRSLVVYEFFSLRITLWHERLSFFKEEGRLLWNTTCLPELLKYVIRNPCSELVEIAID